MLALPAPFQNRMRQMLQEEYPEFLRQYSLPEFRGIRFNRIKWKGEPPFHAFSFPLKPAPFAGDAYYLPDSAEKMGTHPLHHAGAYYIQEPSASCAVTALSPQPGEKILDLCAAPGGKSTQIASCLNGKGLLWANEIIRNRASVLLSNLERMGVSNAVVSSCHPEQLCSRLQGFFDRVLVDAPCSGDGMFRREPQAIKEWSGEHVAACAQRQRAILESAANAVKENGILVYSTCTFSKEENEETVRHFLREHPDFVLEPITEPFGRAALQMPEAKRIFPMDGGEGHFVARMRRCSANFCTVGEYRFSKHSESALVHTFFEENFCVMPELRLAKIGTKVLQIPKHTPDLTGLTILRAGVLIGEIRGNRLEPAHALFMACSPKQVQRCADYPFDSPQLAAFLRGEEVSVEEHWKGYAAVSVEGVVTGFGKASQGRLKNHYPKGLRNYH